MIWTKLKFTPDRDRAADVRARSFADAFSDGWRSFGRSFQRFILNLTEALPSLILLAVFIIVVVVIVRRA